MAELFNRKYKKKEVLTVVDKYIADCQEYKFKLPKVESLAILLKVERKTLYNWSKKYKEFKDRLDFIKLLQYEKLVDDGIYRKTNQGVVKIMLINNHNMKSDKIEDVTPIGKAISDEQINRIAERVTRRRITPGITPSEK